LQAAVLDVGGQAAGYVDAAELDVVGVAAEQAVNRLHAVIERQVQRGRVVQAGSAFGQRALEGRHHHGFGRVGDALGQSIVDVRLFLGPNHGEGDADLALQRAVDRNAADFTATVDQPAADVLVVLEDGEL